MSNNKIIPCFWYEKDSLEAMRLYASLFPDSTFTAVNNVLSSCHLDGCQIWGINGGPMFTPNLTLSLYTICTSKDEITKAVESLVEGGRFLMPLDKYEWSECYTWLEDRYGVSWQLTIGKIEDTGQRITPALLYTGDNYGKARQAMKELIQIFPNADEIFTYPYEDEKQNGKVAHAQFKLLGKRMIIADGGNMHHITFNEGNSLVIKCENQAEIDHYWHSFTNEGKESQCGWCKDKYGFSWQIIPRILEEYVADPEKEPKATAAFLKMKKMELARIEAAVHHS